MRRAAEEYRLTHQRWPESLAQLVQAGLLANTPIDEFDGQPLRWRRTADGLVIYSIGPSRKYEGDALDEATDPARAIFSPNREARQPLAKEALSALMHCLTASHGTAPKSSAPSRTQTRASVAASTTPSK